MVHMKKILFSIIVTMFLAPLALPATARAYVNPNTYQIEIVGNGTTYLKNITIRGRFLLGEDWTCYSDDMLLFNNTGQDSYLNPGISKCENTWAYYSWDVTGYDGNVMYGLKTVHIRLHYGWEDDFTSRSVLYQQKPVPPSAPPPPKYKAKPIPEPKVVAPVQPPITITPETPKKVEEKPKPPKTVKTVPPVSKSVLVASEKTKSNWPTYLTVSGFLLLLALISYQSYVIRKLNQKLRD